MAAQLRAVAVALADPRLPADVRRTLGRRLVGVGDLAKRDLLAAERALRRLADRVAEQVRAPGSEPMPGPDRDGEPRS